MSATTDQQLLERIATLYQDHNYQKGIECLNKISKQDQTLRTLSIVGGFSQGKSTFVNKLIDQDLLPASFIPTTTVLTEIKYAPLAKATFESKEQSEALELNKETLRRFTAEGDRKDSKGLLKISLPVDFLQNGLTIYDTPGVDDLLQDRANVTFMALDRSDFAIICISATKPLSMTEQAFIKSYLLEKKVPKLAILVNFMDQVDEDELEDQITYIKNKAHNLFPEIECWTLYDQIPSNVGSQFDAVGRDQIIQKILAWGSDPRLEQLRSKRNFESISNTLKAFYYESKNELDLLSSNLEETTENLKRNKQQFQLESQDWIDLKNDFIAKSDVVITNIGEDLQQFNQKLFNAELNSENFAANIRVELGNLANSIAKIIDERIKIDLEELLQKISTTFGIKEPHIQYNIGETELPTINGTGFYELEEENPYSTLIDYFLDKLLYFIPNLSDYFGSIKGIPIHELLKEPLTKVVHTIKNNIQVNRKKELLEKYSELIQSTLNALNQHFSTIIKDHYNNIADQIKDLQVKWIEKQENQITLAKDVDQLNARKAYLNNLVDQIQELIAELEERVND